MQNITLTQEEAHSRLVRPEDRVSCSVAFIDCKLPGSHLKQNYSFIGPGVTQSASQGHTALISLQWRCLKA